jgi:hypothetical protein
MTEVLGITIVKSETLLHYLLVGLLGYTSRMSFDSSLRK